MEGIIIEENSIAIPFEVETLRENFFARLSRKSELLFKRTIRRITDIIVSIIGIMLLIPITVLILLGKLVNRDFTPLFQSEVRMGKNGKLFKMYKYNINTESEQGKFFEQTSIDEFPQFINILFGDMTLVGPRPYRADEKEKMGPYYKYISQLKPGLTGVYQICGRVKMDFYDRLDIDTRYYYNRRFWIDIKILLITLLITTKRKEVGKFADYTYTTLKEVISIILKRMIDILGAIVGIAILIPLTAIVAVVNFVSGDGGPIFYSQERIGRYGKHFKMYKFRSMVVGADDELKTLLENDPEAKKEYQKYKKLKNDPRITKIGNFLRKTSLDEFPQFINVLKGEMSLVGPRAYLPNERKDMEKAYEYIIKCKPGITGLWQVSGRNDVTFDERLGIDIEYYNKANTALDIDILIKTVTTVWKKEGAV